MPGFRQSPGLTGLMAPPRPGNACRASVAGGPSGNPPSRPARAGSAAIVDGRCPAWRYGSLIILDGASPIPATVLPPVGAMAVAGVRAPFGADAYTGDSPPPPRE